MADQGTIEVIREALAESGGVEVDRVELVLDDGAVVLRGAVSTAEQASLAAMVAEQHADEVRNLLSVDAGLRENEADHMAVATDAAERAADDGLPGQMQDQDRPLMEEWSAQTSQQTDVTMRRPDDDQVTDIEEALGENVAWDPPTQPHMVPTRDEQRGLISDQELEPLAEQGADGDGPPSLPGVSQAELERDARPNG